MMKKYIIIFLVAISLPLYSQDKYQPFIQEMKEAYKGNLPKFQKKAKRATRKAPDIKEKSLAFLFIPELLLKKSKKLYTDIDSTDLIQYLDPYSMYLEWALVSIDSVYIGNVISMYPKKEIYKNMPKVEDYIFKQIYKRIIEINPDLVFEVQNVPYYFFIKNNDLFALTWDRSEETDFTIYPLDKYVEIFKESIFDVGFRYTPRIPKIVVR